MESAAIDEPLPGTAPFARAWIVVEHPGPWGRDALADNRLPEPVRAHLQTAKAHGVSVLLARHPDRPERSGAGEVNVWIARPSVGGMLMRHGLLTDLSPVLSWDLPALADGSLPPFGSMTRSPLLLVCTHSRRDRCCAVHGRALLNAIRDSASPDQRGRVWECSHIGGHRFAPVTLTLPSGAVHGRLSPELAWAFLEAADDARVLPVHLRGRSALPAPFQAAEIAVRRAADVDGADDLDVLRIVGDRAVPAVIGVPDADLSEAQVRHRDGRAWQVHVVRRELTGLRAESCGAEQLPAFAWECSVPVPVAPWTTP